MSVHRYLFFLRESPTWLDLLRCTRRVVARRAALGPPWRLLSGVTRSSAWRTSTKLFTRLSRARLEGRGRSWCILSMCLGDKWCRCTKAQHLIYGEGAVYAHNIYFALKCRAGFAERVIYSRWWSNKYLYPLQAWIRKLYWWDCFITVMGHVQF